MTLLKESTKLLLFEAVRKAKDAAGVRSRFSNIYPDVKQNRSDLLKATGAQMAKYMQENFAYDFQMYPAQRYVKDQCILFMQHIMWNCSRNTMTVQELREGLENLHSLLYILSTKDIAAFRTLVADLLLIIPMMKDLINEAERFAECKPTDWDEVARFIKQESEMVTLDAEYITAKVAYFSLDRLLGAGGFGAVYKASMGESACVVKFVPTTAIPSLSAAVADKTVACMINHPCLVKYYACFLVKGAYVTAMEYIRGVDIIRLLKLSTRLSENFVKVIISQLGLALIHMHRKGFIHRDVKPANMMITFGCRVKLIDFDTARVCVGKYNSQKMWSWLQKTAKEFEGTEMAGTLPYMAPEMFTNAGFGRALDWWSMGVTTYELVTGKLPFALRRNVEHMKAVIISGKYEWPKYQRYSREIRDLVAHCLNAKAKDRLCSRSYHEFLRHPFFLGQDWYWVQTANTLMQFDPVTFVTARQSRTDLITGSESPQASPTADWKRMRLFGSNQFEDTTEEQQLFTYSSPGFIRFGCRKEVLP
ncbi:probable serine/threonine-protein kinase DDB_G0277449 isoform X3 [Varroa destructor]|uniref:Protein kinase domain-containing protein n=1 Tax=Varroa destructor TaxID=109461 RepID=A0A7M7M6L9_VARDE|nr:probable serine/threonine-protein kinase DDB_G0277449 isoform X3 [Varroa destructor]